MSENNPFEVLGVNLGASDDDIKKGYERMRRIFADDSPLALGLYSEHTRKEMAVEIEKAFRELADPHKRQRIVEKFRKQRGSSAHSVHAAKPAADEQKFSERPQPPKKPQLAKQLPQKALPELSINVDEIKWYDGATLKSIREELGIELQAISYTTRISTANLTLIEDDRYDLLPAPVYVRGFLVEYAKYIGLNPQLVSSTYMEKMKAAAGEQGKPPK